MKEKKLTRQWWRHCHSCLWFQTMVLVFSLFSCGFLFSSLFLLLLSLPDGGAVVDGGAAGVSSSKQGGYAMGSCCAG
jgi:hypothetical protein